MAEERFLLRRLETVSERSFSLTSNASCPPSPLDVDLSCQESEDTIKKSQSFQKALISQMAIIEQREQQKERPLRPVNVTSCLPAQLQKIVNRNWKIVVACFGTDRKVIINEDDIKEYLGEGIMLSSVRCQKIIPLLVSHYFKIYLNFEPCDISIVSFELLSDTGSTTTVLNKYSLSQLKNTQHSQNIKLVRKKRCVTRRQHFRKGQQQREGKKDIEFVQIIITGQSDIIEAIDRNKTGAQLKQRAAGFQHFDKVMMVYYSTLRPIDLKKKICEMGEKVFEIYREQVTEYQDRIFLKRDKIIKDMASSCVVNEEKCVTEQIPICSSVFTGQQFVAIEGANIIETCNGGLLKWIYGETRVLCRSVHTLIAIRSEDNRLQLQHMYITGKYKIHYDFDNHSDLETVLRQLVRAGRKFKKNFKMIK